ncbi:transmembrane protein [Cystoisospora suis]|uniref:Transmembrane protein n=1 Tax=Cystoisospora suis TaxID=483139 RepID=A0A2C6KJW9_9APIC|nr:transmembrane protein [Cystoisospora suis]
MKGCIFERIGDVFYDTTKRRGRRRRKEDEEEEKEARHHSFDFFSLSLLGSSSLRTSSVRKLTSRFFSSSSSFLSPFSLSHFFVLLLILLLASIQTPSPLFSNPSSLSSPPSFLLVNGASSSQISQGRKEEKTGAPVGQDRSRGGEGSLRSGQQTDKPVLLEYKANGAGGGPVACAQNLRDAVNGAISEISGTRALVEHLLRLWDSVPYVPVLVCPSSLFPFAPTLPWPKKAKLKDGDLLKDVLRTGTLTVASVGSKTISRGKVRLVFAQDRGDEGNYNPVEPTGFFPQYMRMIASTIGRHYGVDLSVHWVLYPSVEEAQKAVLDGKAHMTDIYFYLGQSTPGELQPLLHFYPTCPVVGSPAMLIVREDEWQGGSTSPSSSSLDGENKTSVSPDSRRGGLVYLNRRIDESKEDWERTVVFLSDDLAATVQHSLSSRALIHHARDMETALAMVSQRKALAVFVTGIVPTLPSPLRKVNANLLLAKGAWIKRTHALECMDDEHENQVSSYAKAKGSVAGFPGQAIQREKASVRKSGAISHRTSLSLWPLMVSLIYSTVSLWRK